MERLGVEIYQQSAQLNGQGPLLSSKARVCEACPLALEKKKWDKLLYKFINYITHAAPPYIKNIVVQDNVYRCTSNTIHGCCYPSEK